MSSGNAVTRVASRDGTEIAYERTGEGPPLVLVHGTAGDRTDWRLVLPGLAEQFTVYALDRRGRGESGDSDEYALEREFEDVAAVVDVVDDPVVLLGHSAGALYSLEAALLTDNLERLVLYEPPITEAGESLVPEETVARIETLLSEGDREAALTVFLREVAGESQAEIETLKAGPAWDVGIEVAHTVPREVRALDGYRVDPDRFAAFTVPTLLLSGGESPLFMEQATALVDKALPDTRIVTLPGQGHEATNTAPELFVETVVGSLRAPE
ncbi:alpha/beta fold hydrolase [Haloprofundus salinisoli]|uniref:alpha/beta fold hydrolase n=1 Tax=Haloprofundus salinisoli TaxID=2876193 RepID=UPI001CCC487D|nr:alpha/beta hydrolase [Haloprofundus salinisoli]